MHILSCFICSACTMHCQHLLTFLCALLGTITTNPECLHLQPISATIGPVCISDCIDALRNERPFICINLQTHNSSCEQPSIYLLSWKEGPNENLEFVSQCQQYKTGSSCGDGLTLHFALTVPRTNGEVCDEQICRGKSDMATPESSLTHPIYNEHLPKKYAMRDVGPTLTSSKNSLNGHFNSIPQLSSSARRYQGMMISLLSMAQYRISRKFHVPKYPRHVADSWQDSRRDLGRRTGHFPRSCEDTICAEVDGSINCLSEELSEAERSLCDMCYPSKKDDLLKAHCQRQEARSLRVFYKVCIVLGAFIGGAFLSCLIRWVVKTLRAHYRRISGVNLARPTSEYDADFPLEPAISTSMSFVSDSTGAANGPIQQGTTSAPRGLRRVNTFGVSMKSPRRDVRDLFDLAPAEPNRQNTARLDNRIPVLPRAPNASVKRH
jgi:hypothetical protein